MFKLFVLLLSVFAPLSHAGEKSDILLGQVVSVSSPLVGEISNELKLGYEAYFAQVNAQGGIHGRKIRLIQKDDAYVANNTLALTRELIDSDKVIALVGYLGTPGPSLVVKENLLVRNDIALIGPSTGVSSLLAEKNVFPVRASYEAELTEIVAHAKAMQHRRIALIAWNAGAGPLLADAFPQIVRKAGLDLAYRKLFQTSRKDADMEHALQEAIAPLREIQPDATVLIAGGTALYEAIRELRKHMPATRPLYTISSVNWQDLVKNLGTKQCQGIVISQAVPYPYSPQLPIVKSYLEQMRRMGRPATYYSLEGYLGGAVAAEALRRAGPEATSRSVVDALYRMGRQQFGGFEIDYSAVRRQGFGKPEATLITSKGTLLR